MSASVQKRHPFRELLARHGRILTFQATPDDYRALGWWDLIWGLALTWIINVLPAQTQAAFEVAARAGFQQVVGGCVRGLEWMLVTSLLRPRGISAWHAVPLLSLTYVPTILNVLPFTWGIDQEPLAHHIFWAIWFGWRTLVFLRFLRDGARFCLPIAVVAALVTMLGGLIVRLGLPWYALPPVLLLYLLYVAQAWWPTDRQSEKVKSAEEPEAAGVLGGNGSE